MVKIRPQQESTAQEKWQHANVNGDRRYESKALGGSLEDECITKSGIEGQNKCIWQPLP